MNPSPDTTPPNKSRKPNGYWTAERVTAEAALYDIRSAFKTGSPSAYNVARRLGILDQVCAHMVKLVHGWGINDSEHPVITEAGDPCPFYVEWSSMVQRVHDPKSLAKRPSYRGTSICPEWQYFSVFREWMETQPYKTRYLDKDIILPGNRCYSPETCAFVSLATNSLLTSCKATRGDLPRGVKLDKRSGKYTSKVRFNGKSLHLGTFDNPHHAACAYNLTKAGIVAIAAGWQGNPAVARGLDLHALLIIQGIEV